MATPLRVAKTKLKHPPLTIHTLGDKVLRQPAKRVTQINDDIRELAKAMLQTMYSSDGVGLAAPQIGIGKRIIVVDPDPDKPNAPAYIMINPELKACQGSLENGQEGCLSVPDVYSEVKRYPEVTVTYKDELGRPQTMVAKGFLARIIQHEIDHLDGVMFVDHVENSFVLDQELRKHGFTMQDVHSRVPA
ncbi:MAG: peptide deformylase [Synechococcales cyanobacterium]